jgi:hypothetical protein
MIGETAEFGLLMLQCNIEIAAMQTRRLLLASGMPRLVP